MSAALGLYRLQQVDSQIDAIRARLAVIRQTLENDLKRRTAAQALSVAEDLHRQATSTLKQSEAEVERQTLKIKQNEASLYSGNVKNPKELQDLQQDIASLKKHLSTLEERELEAMLRAEETAKKVELAKAQLADIESNLLIQNRDLASETEKLNADLERLQAERQAVISTLSEQALKTYEGLRQHKRGIAVAIISEDACSACGTTLTASQQQFARLPQLFYCPTCGRVLYAG
jgi:predicted  nucleic acid-binding Zn-ribbon protein